LFFDLAQAVACLARTASVLLALRHIGLTFQRWQQLSGGCCKQHHAAQMFLRALIIKAVNMKKPTTQQPSK
jgi:hypothetical protein